MPPNSIQYEAATTSPATTKKKTTTAQYGILRKHVNSCKDISPGSFISRIVLARLDEEERTILGSSTLTPTNSTMEMSSNRSNEMKVNEIGNNSPYCSTDIALAKDIYTLQRYIQNYKKVPPTSEISRAVLSRLKEHALQLNTNTTTTTTTTTRHPPSSSSPKEKGHSKLHKPTPTIKHHPLLSLLRFLLLDTSLALLFLLFLLAQSLQLYYSTHLTPILQSSDWVTPTTPTGQSRLLNEFTYYDRQCDASDVTTRSMDDLTIRDEYGDGDEDQVVENFMVHGAAVFPRLLGEETADDLREHILKRNGELTDDESIPLDGAENRFSYGIGANEHPTVTKALQEIASNTLLTKSLTKLLGPNPAVAEITAITVQYGAENQGWHSDVKAAGNSVKYSRTFTHSYSLFVPLQNVTVAMGATEICPGTHMCPNDLDHTCHQVGFPAVPRRNTGRRGEEPVWRVGDALVMNQCMWHRGPAHTSRNAPSRVVFILTFLSRPDPINDPRQLSHGTYFHIRPDMYGFTLNDLRNPVIRMKAPFSWLRSLGIWKPKSADWGWDWPTMTLLRISNEENGYHPDDLPWFLQDHGLAKSIPQILHGGVREGKDGGWRGYLGETAFNFKAALGLAYLLAFVAYLTMVLSLDLVLAMRSGGSGERNYCRSMLVRTLVLNLILVSVVYGMYLHLVGTPWIKSIESGTSFKRPFVGRSIVEGEENYDDDRDDTTALRSLSSSLPSLQRHQLGPRLTTVPEKMDVLFSRRFDSKHIGYYRNFLNYHPGNVQFNTDLGLKSATYNSYAQISDIFGHRLVDEILKNVYQTGSRFLSQNDFGEWTVMDRQEVEEMVVKQLLTRKHSVFAVLEKELSFLISANDEHIKHHGGKEAFWRMAGENLSRWKLTFDQKLLAVGAITTTGATIGRGEEIQQKPRQRNKLLSSLFKLQPCSARTSSGSLPLTTVTRSKRGTLKQKSDIIRKGDKVYAHNRSEWKVATVMAIFDKKAMVKPVHEHGGGQFKTRLDKIIPFRPLTQGGRVEVFFPEKEEEEETWMEGVIARAYPDRTYDIWYWDENDDGEYVKEFVFRIPHDRVFALISL